MNNFHNLNSILNGFGKTERIVAVQQISPNKMRLYIREDGEVKYIDKDFYPFFYLTDINLLNGFNEKFWQKRAEGNGEYKYICVFEDWSGIWRAIRFIHRKLNLDSKQQISFTDIPEIYFRADPINQFLLQSGETFFKQMEFDEIHRMQIDIETYSSKGFSQASRKSDSIIIITLSDNFGWEMVLSGKKMTEKEMLFELIRIINEKDPDIIEGHNIINFDLIYILDRCSLYNIEFKIGRDGSSPLVETSKSAGIERSTFDITIAGRQIVDTYHLVLQHDLSKREMEDYSLKSSAKHFGISPSDRIYIPGEKISWYWDNDPEILIEYAKDDVEETRLLSNILLPIYFYQAQILPLNFDQVMRAGISNKIESLMVREYLRRKYSLPTPKAGTQTTGGFTAVFYSGLFDRIVHADVESLYPSIILNQKISPRSDELGIFLELLKVLTEQRISLKRRMKSEVDLSLRNKYDSMQSSLKIFINSFYGYLGYFKGIFNDFEKADQVTKYGQVLIKQIIEEFNSNDCTVIEVDTDGLYFSPPEYIKTETDEIELVKSVAEKLPSGINLTYGGRYSRMLSYKKKNYALLTYDNRLLIKGSSLISRSIEKYARNFIKFCIESILTNNIEDIPKVYLNLRADIINHAISIRDLCKVETLKDSFEDYTKAVEEGRRARSAPYELAIKYFRDKFKPGDKIIYYITGSEPNVKIHEACELIEAYNPNLPNENVAYYLKKLEEYVERFRDFFSPKDFKNLFPTEDKFQFAFDKITVLNKKIEEE